MTVIQSLRNTFKFDKDSPWYFYRKVAWWSFVVSTCLMLPFVLYTVLKAGSPIFSYYGDYNAQQLCFYEHCVDMVRNGSFGWDWVNDIGSNFIGSYSYYMIGSPFFWVMTVFPSSWAPYLMAPMFVVKYVIAAIFAYAYIQRFVKNKDYAVIGAMLYAFCGFQIYNTFFNQFHDVVAFFPLLLIGMEEYVQNNRKGIFAIAVALNAMINYFMFAGQVVFCVIYFIARMSTTSFKITLKKFFGLALEAVLGFMMAMIIFLPAASSLMGNDRLSNSYTGHLETAIKELLEKDWYEAWKSFKKLLVWETGGDWYWQRYGQIFESYFFPPDIPSRVNFFDGHTTRWASISMYLPLFGLTGVFSLFTVKKRGWLKGLMIFLVISSFVPVLNSMFFLFNSAYYARWLYLMMLMFSLATAVSLEDSRTKWKVPTAIMTFFCAITAIPWGLMWLYNNKDKLQLGYPTYRARFWLYVGLAFLGIIVTAWLIRRYRGTKMFERVTLFAVSGMILLYGWIHLANGRSYGESAEFMVNIIENDVELPDPHEEFYRIDEFRNSKISTIDNLGLYWNYPTVENFHTIVPESILTFYDNALGTRRSVGSRPESDQYGYLTFASVKYSLIQTNENNRTDKKENHDTYGYEYLESQNGFDIYLNTNYLNMGFAYNKFMTQSDFEAKYGESQRHAMLCKYLVVPDDKADYYSQFMQRVIDNSVIANETNFKKSVEERREMCCDTFNYDSYGFDATINLDSPNVVLFSVPYEDGWSAKVNGQETEVLRVTYGFVAVEVPAGESKIEFEYRTTGMFIPATITLGESKFELPGGGWISLVALVIFIGYMAYFKVYKKHKADTKFFSFDYYDDMYAYEVPTPETEEAENTEGAEKQETPEETTEEANQETISQIDEEIEQAVDTDITE